MNEPYILSKNLGSWLRLLLLVLKYCMYIIFTISSAQYTLSASWKIHPCQPLRTRRLLRRRSSLKYMYLSSLSRYSTGVCICSCARVWISYSLAIEARYCNTGCDLVEKLILFSCFRSALQCYEDDSSDINRLWPYPEGHSVHHPYKHVPRPWTLVYLLLLMAARLSWRMCSFTKSHLLSAWLPSIYMVC